MSYFFKLQCYFLLNFSQILKTYNGIKWSRSASAVFHSTTASKQLGQSSTGEIGNNSIHQNQQRMLDNQSHLNSFQQEGQQLGPNQGHQTQQQFQAMPMQPSTGKMSNVRPSNDMQYPSRIESLNNKVCLVFSNELIVKYLVIF